MSKKKREKNESKVLTFALATAILELIIAVIDLITRLLE